MIFADVSLNQFRVISKATGSLLSFESEDTIEFYYVNKGPVIFRTTVLKDKEDKFRLFMNQLPSAIPLRRRLQDDLNLKLDELKDTLQDIENTINDKDDLFS